MIPPGTVVHDWEFLENGVTIRPISVALVAADGREYHAVFEDLPYLEVRSHPWLNKHVWPHLPRRKMVTNSGTEVLDWASPLVKPRQTIKQEVTRFLGDTPNLQLWGDHPSYDHVCLSQLFGTMAQLPSWCPQRTNDLAQEAARLSLSLPAIPASAAHHPLADARWMMYQLAWLTALELGVRRGDDAYPLPPHPEELLREPHRLRR